MEIRKKIKQALFFIQKFTFLKRGEKQRGLLVVQILQEVDCLPILRSMLLSKKPSRFTFHNLRRFTILSNLPTPYFRQTRNTWLDTRIFTKHFCRTRKGQLKMKACRMLYAK